jgi:hypothetical protein
MTPAIILGTIFFIIIIFSASVSLYKAIIHLKENDFLKSLPVLVIVLILIYSLLMLGFIKYILYTFK